MLRSFEGPTANYVGQQVVEVFQLGDSVLVQPRKGGATKEILYAANTRGNNGQLPVSLLQTWRFPSPRLSES